MKRPKFHRRKPTLDLPAHVYDAYRRVRYSLDFLNQVFLDDTQPTEARLFIASTLAFDLQKNVINFVSALLVEVPNPELPPSTTVKE